jgi:hypothetical protein
MSHTTLFIILDAGRADYVRPDTMPFLHGLAARGLRGAVETPPGFAQNTVLFTGRYPDTSGQFAQFVFDPERSPFKWVKGLGPLGAAVRPRKAMFPARVAIGKVTAWATGAEPLDPAWIPPRLLPFFAPCDDRRRVDGLPTGDPGATAASLFDLCREHGLTYRYLAYPEAGEDDAIHDALARELRAGPPCDLYVARFRVLDRRGHADGPDTEAMGEHLRTLDRKLAGLHAALAAGYRSWDLLVVGPHGMAPIQRRVDVLAALQGCDAAPAKDYVLLLNSTFALVWYLTPRGRAEVEARLRRLPGARFVDEAERRRRRIPTSRGWGDAMLAAEPGVLFWPDHFHARDSTVEGMHGYLDKREEGHGALVLASSTPRPPGDLGLRPLVDAFPTLCRLLDLPVPAFQEGVSLLEPPEVALPQLARA